MFKSLKKAIALTIFSGLLISNVSFAQNTPSPCELVEFTYKTCYDKAGGLLKNSPVDEKRKACSFMSMSLTVDMYKMLLDKYKDNELAKSISVVLGLICKDGCMGTDDFYSASKKKLCK